MSKVMGREGDEPPKPYRPRVWVPRGWTADPEVVERTPPTISERTAAEWKAIRDSAHGQALRQMRVERHRLQGGIMRELSGVISRELRGRPMSAAAESIDPRLMSDAQLKAWAEALLLANRYDWAYNARPEQWEPADYETWLISAGRGNGKTRTGAETIRKWCNEAPGRYAVVAKDWKQLRDVCFEGESGLLEVIPAVDRLANFKGYKRGLGDVSLELANGSLIQGFSSHEPDSLRGPAFKGCWGDEYAAWPASTAQEVLDMFWMTSRGTENARLVLTTTPKRVKHVVELLRKSDEPIERIVVTHGTTMDNTALPQAARDRLYRQFGGTRQGLQELEGVLITALDNALWTPEMIEAATWHPPYDESTDDYEPVPAMAGVVIGLDPSGSEDGDATGIVAVGWDRSKTIWVLENSTRNGTPAERYRAVCLLAFKHGAGEVWFETAYGGDQAAYGVQEEWKNLRNEGVIPADRRCPWLRPSTIKGSKAHRAGPVVAMMEQQLNLPEFRNLWILEPTPENDLLALTDELVSWETDSKKSPNALDAMVHACRQLRMKLGFEASVGKAHTSRRLARRPGDPIGGAKVYNPFKRVS